MIYPDTSTCLAPLALRALGPWDCFQAQEEKSTDQLAKERVPLNWNPIWGSFTDFCNMCFHVLLLKKGAWKGTTTSWTRKCRPGVAAVCFSFFSSSMGWSDLNLRRWRVPSGSLNKSRGTTTRCWNDIDGIRQVVLLLDVMLLFGHVVRPWWMLRLCEAQCTKSFFSYACFKLRQFLGRVI